MSATTASKLSVEVEFKARPSLPIAPSPSPEGTIGKDILPPLYAQEQHETWRTLYDRQEGLLTGRVCEEYQEGRRILGYERDRVPHLADLSERLRARTGWQSVRVNGYVPEPIFFSLLAKKQFPCTDFLRHPTELEYTPAPDMFHDLMGHLPMIANPRFSSFFHLFGLAGTRAHGEEETTWLGRIYWYTVEFGLINPTAHWGARRDPSRCKIYGAGISSSVGEIVYALSSQVKKAPFNLDVITTTPVEIHHMQEQLFEIESFDELESQFTRWATERNLLPA
jgi:phenylalanine-4-hydroxylase